MLIEIKLPSPVDLSIADWFEQMELALFHAKKSYEKFSAGIEPEKQDNISIHFSYPGMEKNGKYLKWQETEEMDFDDTQEIMLNISY